MSRSFLAIPRPAIDDRRLNSGDRDMLLTLCSMLSREHPDCCWPSKSYLVERLEVHENTVKRQLRKLRDTGYISRPQKNAGRKPGAIFINFDVVVPEDRLRRRPTSNGSNGALGGTTNGTAEDVRQDHQSTSLECPGGTTDDTPEAVRGGHPCTPQDVRGYYQESSRGYHSESPRSIKGNNLGGQARAHACETEPQAQPPPYRFDDQWEKTGGDASAREPMPELLPADWARIAEHEFAGVDKLDRRFLRFQNNYRGDVLTPEKWRGRWRNWLLDDFEPVDPDAQVLASNGHDPPTAGDPAIGSDIIDFDERVAREFEQFVKRKGLKQMNFLERIGIKASANAIKVGKADKVGLDRVGFWTLEDIAERLGLTLNAAGT